MATNDRRRLPDTPWHIGYACKEEDDPRRHKSRCIHLHKPICHCALSGCYMTTCVGSAHCKYYAEEQSQWEKYLEEMQTEEDAAEIRAAMYRKEKRDYVLSLLKSYTYHKKYNLKPAMTKCPFCSSHLKEFACSYCLAKFKVVKQFTDENIRQAANDGYFLISKT